MSHAMGMRWFAIVTIEPNDRMARFHDRVPVMLDRPLAKCLNPDTPIERVKEIAVYELPI
jgi:putative SOS response-associated peptidase YedK